MKRSGREATTNRPKAARNTPSPSAQPGSETSGKTSGEHQALIPQAHGGALLAGGRPGHKGAGGRPRNEVRDLSLAGYFENLPRLIRIAAGTERRKALNSEGELVEVQPTFKESIEAMKELGNRGIGTKLELEAPASPLAVTVTVGPDVARERGE
jgi:hypothetical protein